MPATLTPPATRPAPTTQPRTAPRALIVHTLTRGPESVEFVPQGNTVQVIEYVDLPGKGIRMVPHSLRRLALVAARREWTALMAAGFRTW